MDNLRRQRFIAEFLKDFNATRAAIRAGYSAKTARQAGSRLLSDVDVQAALRQMQEHAQAHAGITAARIAEELGKVGFATIAAICSWDAQGNVTMKPSDEISPEALAAIAEVQETVGRDGRRIRIRMHSKVAALETLVRQITYAALDERLATLEEERARDQP